MRIQKIYKILDNGDIRIAKVVDKFLSKSHGAINYSYSYNDEQFNSYFNFKLNKAYFMKMDRIEVVVNSKKPCQSLCLELYK